MRRIHISELQPGDVLGSSIEIPSKHSSVHYRLRLETGRELTQEDIDRLKRLEISRVTIQDEATADLEPYIHDEEFEKTQSEVLDEFENFTDRLKSGDSSSPDIGRLRSAIQKLIESIKNSELMAAFTTLKTHDDYTAKHFLDVAKISLQLCLEYEKQFRNKLKKESGASWSYINKYMLEDLGLGAMLHDLGKKEVPEEILQKPKRLTDEEWEEMMTHSEKGLEELKDMRFDINAPVKVPAHQHHEKYDGSGYPRQLEEDEIHLFGRITAVADVYSALTSERPYREAKTPSEALGIMESMQVKGPHFDPDIFDKFKTIVFPFPIGEEVELSDGRRGVVSDIDPDIPEQPQVRILYEDGRRLEEPEEVDLQNRSDHLRIVTPRRKAGGLVRTR